MEAVYEGLPEDLKKEIEGRIAVHDFVYFFGLALSDEERAEKRKQFPPARHPDRPDTPGQWTKMPLREHDLHEPR